MIMTYGIHHLSIELRRSIQHMKQTSRIRTGSKPLKFLNGRPHAHNSEMSKRVESVC